MTERTKSQNGKRSRTKGAAFERWVTKELVRVGISAERNIAQARTAAREGCDVEGTGWWIECKVGADPDPRAAYAQANADRPSHDARPIVVVWKRDRCEVAVSVELYDLVFMAVRRKTPPTFYGGPLVHMRFADWLALATPLRLVGEMSQ